MNELATNRLSRSHWIWRAMGVVTWGAVVLIAATAVRIVRVASRADLRPADAIVVFGAAEYAGHPSPVYRARLDHAYDLFQRGIAPVVITTGGFGYDPDFSESGVRSDYPMHPRIPERR